MDKLLLKVHIRTSAPGDTGYVAYMHGKYYHEHYGFFPAAEYYFIKHLADFVRNPEGGRLWIAETGGITVGSMAVVRVDNKIAQLRWFLVDKHYQGMGIGSSLFQTALDFCRENGYTNMFLWTFKGLDAARHLYDRAGFVVVEEKMNNEWNSFPIIEQKMKLVKHPT
jgi:GNAT superfamily N-acetyltransferase